MDKQLINDLYLAIERKLELFNEIYNITLKQQQDIENNDAENIEALVQQKQTVIDEVDKLDLRFLEGYKTLKETLNIDKLDKIDTDKYPELKKLKENVQKIMEIAPQIMELESSNKEKLDQIFQRVKNEIKQINLGKKSIKAYEPTPVNNDGIFIDKKK